MNSYRDDSYDFVRPTDIARRLGVGPSAVTNWQQRYADFPSPIMVLGDSDTRQTLVYSWQDIKTWTVTFGHPKQKGRIRNDS